MGLTSEERLALFNQFGQKHNYIGAAIIDLLEQREKSVVLQHIGAKGKQKISEGQKKVQKQRQKSKSKTDEAVRVSKAKKLEKANIAKQKLEKAQADKEAVLNENPIAPGWTDRADTLIAEYESTIASTIVNFFAELNWRSIIKMAPPEFLDKLSKHANELANVTVGNVSNAMEKVALNAKKFWDYLFQFVGAPPQAMLQFQSEVDGTFMSFITKKITSMIVSVGKYIWYFAKAIGRALVAIINAFNSFVKTAIEKMSRGISEMASFFVYRRDKWNVLSKPLEYVCTFFFSVIEFLGGLVKTTVRYNKDKLLKYAAPLFAKIAEFVRWVNSTAIADVLTEIVAWLKDTAKEVALQAQVVTVLLNDFFEVDQAWIDGFWEGVMWFLKWYRYNASFILISAQSMVEVGAYIVTEMFADQKPPEEVSPQEGVTLADIQPEVAETIAKNKGPAVDLLKQHAEQVGQTVEAFQKRRAGQDGGFIYSIELAWTKGKNTALFALKREDEITASSMDYIAQKDFGTETMGDYYLFQASSLHMLYYDMEDVKNKINAEPIGTSYQQIGVDFKYWLREGRRALPFKYKYTWDEKTEKEYKNMYALIAGREISDPPTSYYLVRKDIAFFKSKRERLSLDEVAYVEACDRILELYRTVENDMAEQRANFTNFVAGFIILAIVATSWYVEYVHRNRETEKKLAELRQMIIPSGGKIEHRATLEHFFDKKFVPSVKNNATGFAFDDPEGAKRTQHQFTDFLYKEQQFWINKLYEIDENDEWTNSVKELKRFEWIKEFLKEWEMPFRKDVNNDEVIISNITRWKNAGKIRDGKILEGFKLETKSKWYFFSEEKIVPVERVANPDEQILAVTQSILQTFGKKIASITESCLVNAIPGALVRLLDFVSTFGGINEIAKKAVVNITGAKDYFSVKSQSISGVFENYAVDAAYNGTYSAIVVLLGLVTNALLAGILIIYVVTLIFTAVINVIVTCALGDWKQTEKKLDEEEIDFWWNNFKANVQTTMDILNTTKIFFMPLIASMLSNSLAIELARSSIMLTRLSFIAAPFILAGLAMSYYFGFITVPLKVLFRIVKGIGRKVADFVVGFKTIFLGTTTTITQDRQVTQKVNEELLYKHTVTSATKQLEEETSEVSKPTRQEETVVSPPKEEKPKGRRTKIPLPAFSDNAKAPWEPLLRR